MKLSSSHLSYLPFRPVIPLPRATAAGLQLWARRAGDVDRLLHGGH